MPGKPNTPKKLYRFPDRPGWGKGHYENPDEDHRYDLKRHAIYEKALSMLTMAQRFQVTFGLNPHTPLNVVLMGPVDDMGIYENDQRVFASTIQVEEPAPKLSGFAQDARATINRLSWDAGLDRSDTALAKEFERVFFQEERSRVEREGIRRFLDSPLVIETAARNGPNEHVTSSTIVLERLREIAKHW